MAIELQIIDHHLISPKECIYWLKKVKKKNLNEKNSTNLSKMTIHQMIKQISDSANSII